MIVALGLAIYLAIGAALIWCWLYPAYRAWPEDFCWRDVLDAIPFGLIWPVCILAVTGVWLVGLAHRLRLERP